MKPEKALDGKTLYEATMDAYGGSCDIGLPALSWENLTWNEKDNWQAKADELNEARRENA